MVPKPIVLVDPVTGSEAPGYASGSGISPVPASYFDGYLDAPRFRRGQANLTTIESLIEHVNRFKDSQSVLFAVDDRKRPSITAIIDYPPAGGIDETAPRHGAHRSMFAFPLSAAWNAWVAKNGRASGWERVGQ